MTMDDQFREKIDFRKFFPYDQTDANPYPVFVLKHVGMFFAYMVRV